MGGGAYDDYGRGGKGRGRDSRSPPRGGNDGRGRGRDNMSPPRRGGYDDHDAPRGKGGGRRRDSRSPPPRGGDYGGKGRENDRRGRGGGDSSSRYSPPPRRGGYSPPPRDGKGGSRYSPPPRGGDRGGKRDWLGPPRDRRSRSRSRDRDKAAPKEKLTYDPNYRIPPPNRKRGEGAPPESNLELTPEMKQNSFEHEGFYYATADFTAPQTPCGISPVVPKPYDGTKRTDPSWIPWCRCPKGWNLVPSDDLADSVKEKVIGAFDWGTHLLVVEKGRAYVTQGGKARGKPGTLQMIWDMEKGPDGIKLQTLKGSHSYWHGKLFMRAQIN